MQHVDLCKPFDSMNGEALWRILGLRGVPPKLINLMSELYSGTENAVRSGDTMFDSFPGDRWSDCVSNEWLLRKTQMRFVTCIVREGQLRLYGHMARFPDADPAHQILSAREPREWRRPMGRPRGCRMLISISRRWGWAWSLPGGWPDGGPWSTGGKWMQRRAALAHAPIPDLICVLQC